jgi:hypothetical protein
VWCDQKQGERAALDSVERSGQGDKGAAHERPREKEQSSKRAACDAAGGVRRLNREGWRRAPRRPAIRSEQQSNSVLIRVLTTTSNRVLVRYYRMKARTAMRKKETEPSKSGRRRAL